VISKTVDVGTSRIARPDRFQKNKMPESKSAIWKPKHYFETGNLSINSAGITTIENADSDAFLAGLQKNVVAVCKTRLLAAGVQSSTNIDV